MAIDKIQSESINLADTFAFTGTVTGAGEKNTPCFFASYIGSGVEIADATWTKAEFTTEDFDEGSVYDTSNKRYTPGFIGKSFISSGLWFYDSSSNIQGIQLQFYKNGSGIGIFENRFIGHGSYERQRAYITANIIVNHNATDYYEVYIRSESSNGGNIEAPATSGGAGNYRNYFHGFKVFT